MSDLTKRIDDLEKATQPAEEPNGIKYIEVWDCDYQTGQEELMEIWTFNPETRRYETTFKREYPEED